MSGVGSDRPLARGGLALALGALLWLQTCVGALVELVVGDAEAAHLVACALAAAVLGLGLRLRHEAALLFVFPVTLLLVLHTMSEGVARAAFEPARWLAWIVTLLGFVVAAARWAAPRAEGETERELLDVDPRIATGTPWTWTRIGLAAALLLVPSIALVIRNPGAHFSVGAERTAAFAHVALVFGFVIAFYAAFAAPMLDAEHDRRAALARATLTQTASARRRALAGWAILALACAACVWLLAAR